MMVDVFVRRLAAFSCLVFSAAATQPSAAQHHGGHHGSSHYGGGHGTSHIGGHHGSVHIDAGYGSSHHGGHHSAWAHVVPSYHRHTGVYYSYGGASYYTPVEPPLRVQVLRPELQPGTITPPTPPVEPIAPQSVKIEFGGFGQTEDLAARLEIATNRWCLEMHYNYRHNPGFAAIYRDAYKVLLAAKYAHSAEHAQDREAIRSEVAGAESLFHGVQEATEQWTREERRVLGEGSLAAKTAAVESILHHLLFDVGIEANHTPPLEEQAPPPENEPPSAPGD